MRALLVFNPNATTTTDHVRDVVTSALASQVELDVQATKQRGHAIHLAAGAVHEGVDAVFALGGDGTANEVIQGLAGTQVAMAHIPGGGTNVFARTLGLPNDTVAATSVLLDRLRTGQRRRISLGRAGGRYFAFQAGFGFDAAVVRLVERRPRLKRRLRQLAFVECAFEQWLRSLDERGDLHVRLDDGTDVGPYRVTIVGNTDPYTFLGPRPMRVTPQASYDTGLDLVGVRPVSTAGILAIALRVFTTAGHVRDRNVDHWHDLSGLTLHSPHPQPLMVDGDFAGEHHEVRLDAVRDALTVLA
ncbi:MAG TPA: diacylglycerol kinase family protein [Nitriliruptorales bacterium]